MHRWCRGNDALIYTVLHLCEPCQGAKGRCRRKPREEYATSHVDVALLCVQRPQAHTACTAASHCELWGHSMSLRSEGPQRIVGQRRGRVQVRGTPSEQGVGLHPTLMCTHMCVCVGGRGSTKLGEGQWCTCVSRLVHMEQSGCCVWCRGHLGPWAWTGAMHKLTASHHACVTTQAMLYAVWGLGWRNQ
jgi:hypothetical protein